MPTGFQVIGDHGGIQIDENFYNMTLLAKGTTPYNPVDANGDVNWLIPFQFSVSGATTPIICFKTPKVVALATSVKSGSTFTYTGNVFSSDAGSFSWYVFDRMPNVSNHAGLNVYDASGNITFNSDYVPMKIVNLYKLPDGAITASTSSWYTNTSGRDIAACLTSPRIGAFLSGGGMTALYTEGVAADITGAGTASIGIGSIPGSHTGAATTTGGYLMTVDVTGL